MTTLSATHSDSTRTSEFDVGAKVTCTNGPCGKVTRVIIDPIQRRLTHIVVESHHEGRGRLVPLTMVETSTREHVALACSRHGFDALEPSRDSDYLPMENYYGSYYRGYARGCGYSDGDASFLPHYGFGGMGYGYGWGPQTITYDAVPSGEVTIRRNDRVRATDGEIGRVAGFVIGTPTGDITHVLLQEGHLWGKRDVAIPIRAVRRVSDIVEVTMTKHEIEDLPSIDIDHPESQGRST